MKLSPSALKSILAWLAVATLASLVFLAYRWAASPIPPNPHPGVASSGTTSFHMEDMPVYDRQDGRKTWQLHADSVDITPQLHSGLGAIQNATITMIKDGKIFEAPKDSPSRVISPNDPSDNSLPDGKVAATFKANQGQYALGNMMTPPSDLDSAFSVIWQFNLTGDVEFAAAAGEKMTSQSLVIYSLAKKGGGKPFLRIVCDNGAKIIRNKIEVVSNKVRYQPSDGVIECLGGVRCVFDHGTVQAERIYWSLKEEVLRCPDTASGKYDDTEFTLTESVFDMKRQRRTWRHGVFYPGVSNSFLPKIKLP